ncbi:MAG: RNA methyltransferase [Catalinimonas sp.]
MVPKRLLKHVNDLQRKKYRRQTNAFLVEGAKSVRELLDAPDFEVQHVLATAAFLEQHHAAVATKVESWYEVDDATLRRAGTLVTPNGALAVVALPDRPPPDPNAGWLLALDGVNDPGNLGALVRLADWYGLPHLICSTDTVDLYNPKAVHATMGSFLRVPVHYLDLPTFLDRVEGAVCGALLTGGSSLHGYTFPASGVIVLGSESHGIRPEVAPLVTTPLTIPRFGGAESLNVALAGAVFCDRLRGG